MISIRRLGTTEPAPTIVFYFTLFATLGGALSLPFQWHTPDLAGLLILVSIGLIGGFAQMAMTQGFRLAPVAVVAPFEYSSLVFAVGFGYLIWGDFPGLAVLGGAALVVASGLYILHRETILARAARAKREGPPRLS
jgi:drug/metabolite transporter (DMT)-like permease